VNESKQFRIKRAADTVVRLAAEWSRAYHTWVKSDDGALIEDELFVKARGLRVRLDGAAHELAALEDEL
jgi:hypothetical protein